MNHEMPCLGEYKDDRFEGVILLAVGDGWKKTAEEKEHEWLIVDWIDYHDAWMDESTYTISKGDIFMLTQAGAK